MRAKWWNDAAVCCRYHLGGRRQGDTVSGEVMLVLGVVPRPVYESVNWSEDAATLLDPSIQKV